jgi:hypothetical protein
VTYGGDSGNRISVLYWRCPLIRVSVIRGSTVVITINVLLVRHVSTCIDHHQVTVKRTEVFGFLLHLHACDVVCSGTCCLFGECVPRFVCCFTQKMEPTRVSKRGVINTTHRVITPPPKKKPT